MKRSLKIIISIAAIFSLQLIANNVNAWDPPPPPNGHGETGDQEPAGGGAPIAGGIPLLILMGAAYGAKRYIGIIKEGEIKE